jgi:hypothetical protein
MTNNSFCVPRVPLDQRIRAIGFIADMIEYRNSEITRISEELRQGIRHLHREQHAKKHARQADILAGMTDRLHQLMTDNEYDVNHLQIYLAQAPVNNASSPTNIPAGNAHDLHYFQ